MSSLRVIASATGRPSTSTAEATSGSMIIILPPNAPPSGALRIRIRSTGSPNSLASESRVANGAWVELRITSSPSVSSQAIADWGSM